MNFGKRCKCGILSKGGASRFYAIRKVISWTASKETGKRMAIIGSGPAGLMAAHELPTQEHSVTVFDFTIRQSAQV
jgi:NADPH-dependent 2,4-dienoyl-CoA reductase/sulfur reductase-like enzyme